jgi:hypothetical protein
LSYQGVRDFRTGDPSQLREDLQRQNQRLEEAFDKVERDTDLRGQVVQVTESEYRAKHGDVVVAGYDQDTKIFLPEATQETENRRVRVIRVGGAGDVIVVAPPDQTVNSTSSVTITTTGFRDFVCALRNWWGPAL